MGKWNELFTHLCGGSGRGSRGKKKFHMESLASVTTSDEGWNSSRPPSLQCRHFPCGWSSAVPGGHVPPSRPHHSGTPDGSMCAHHCLRYHSPMQGLSRGLQGLIAVNWVSPELIAYYQFNHLIMTLFFSDTCNVSLPFLMFWFWWC